jgi:hypothetical protein
MILAANVQDNMDKLWGNQITGCVAAQLGVYLPE